MNVKNATFLAVLLILSSVPIAHSQVPDVEKAVQRPVEIIVNSSGDAHVKHVVAASSSAKQIELVYGTVSNISVTNEQGEGITEYSVIGDSRGITIEPSQENSIIEYSIDHAMSQKDGIWTWDFRYLETTNFVFPEEVDLIFANNRPVNLDEKRGIACHGCQIILEYSIDEPESLERVDWEGKELVVAIKSHSSIEKLNFDQQAKSITFGVSEENRFVTAVIPSELLAGPYSILLDDDKILFREHSNNGTHVSISMRPDAPGEITILDAAVIPEHLIIALLAVGFLIILVVILVRKFSLR